MSFSTCSLPDVVIVRPKVFPDNRGYFKELSRQNTDAENGINRAFVQVNMSHSTAHVLRGLHYQLKFPQAKLVSVAYGKIYDVIVDCRKSSPAFGQHFGIELSAEGGEELFVPEGFAHGFYVLSDCASVVYQCSDYYHPGDEFGLHWASPSLNIAWDALCPGSFVAPILSDKDDALPRFEDVLSENLPD